MVFVRIHPPLRIDDVVVREYQPMDDAQVNAAGANTTTNPLGIFIGDELVGGAGLHDRNEPMDLELSYWLRPQWQGRGIATRVARLLTAYAFANAGVHRVLIRHIPDNERSSRIPARLGFHQIPNVGSCESCRDVEHVTWAVTRDEWVTPAYM